MHEPPLVLAVDDMPENLEILRLRLEAHGYAVETAADGEEGLARARELRPDLVLLDVMMPRLDGISVVRALKQDPALAHVPVILVTARSDNRDVVEGLDAGADDYLTKPFDHATLMARVRSMLRIKRLHDTVQDQARTLAAQAEELVGLNRSLEGRVAEQVGQIERMGRLRRFLPPQVADMLMASDQPPDPLATHRRDVTVVFCDLRGFTSFTETAEPEEVISVLRAYHAALGEIVFRYEGTLERFVGDGLLVLFNDPIDQPDHASRAARMALDMRERIADLEEEWRRAGHQLGFGVGIASGFATLGGVGYDQRIDYTVIGSVPNLASRLCDEARAGQILVSRRVFAAVEAEIPTSSLGERALKGFQRPVPVYEILPPPDGGERDEPLSRG
jgi:adenylate cyclase